jgi:hypothetical protein
MLLWQLGTLLTHTRSLLAGKTGTLLWQLGSKRESLCHLPVVMQVVK